MIGTERAAQDPKDGSLRPLRGPATYPNLFRDVLAKSEPEIAAKIANAFEQLFHGDPATEAIYFKVGEDQAYIQDILHGDVRSEGIGLAMLIAVQLDKRDEFDRLWRYARTTLEYTSGPSQGYFRSFCAEFTSSVPCDDPYGHQQLSMALLFAHGRWGSTSGTIDYGEAALRLLEVAINKETANGGVVDGVTNLFDANAKLPLDVPRESARGFTRPSVVIPAYYALWAQATGDPFWSAAQTSGRAHLRAVAHDVTGLIPLRAAYDGTPATGWELFGSESYRAQLNITLDDLWIGDAAWPSEVSDRILAFFERQGLASYGSTYTLDGSLLDPAREPALVASNGISAVAAQITDRTPFVQAVWDQPVPTGPVRYYQGLLHLLSLLSLSGQLRVY